MANRDETGLTLQINAAAIRNLTAAAQAALEKTAEAMHTEVVQATVVPRDTGNLQNESFFVDYGQQPGTVSLVFSTPYARRLYYHPEYHFRKDKNPMAQGRWLEPWITGKNRNFAQDAFTELFRREAGLSR